MTSPHRYTTRPLPSYSYVPGLFPHPQSHPAGHSFGRHEPAANPLDEATWPANELWLWAIDLLNHGYYWEAHEAWEGLWHAAGRRGRTADLLKGLIKLAAAGVKAREGRAAGVRLHAARAVKLLSSSRGTIAYGAKVDEILAAAERIERDAESLIGNAAMLPLTIRLAPGP